MKVKCLDGAYVPECLSFLWMWETANTLRLLRKAFMVAE